MISIFALGSDLPEIEVIRSALSEERTFNFKNTLRFFYAKVLYRFHVGYRFRCKDFLF